MNTGMNPKHDPQRELIARAIVVHEGAVLVNQSRNAKTEEEYCALPGGHVDAGESCVAALAREWREELGAEIEIHDLCFASESIYSGRKKEESKRHEMVLYFHADLSTPLQDNGVEIHSPEANKRFRWLPFEELATANLLPQSVKTFLLSMLADEEHPHYVFSDTTQK
jgi:8-oxo-dGTP diphosphatase